MVGAWAEKMLGKLGEKAGCKKKTLVGCTKTMAKYDEFTIFNREIYTSLGDGFNFWKYFNHRKLGKIPILTNIF